jgi:hypothetical protein
MTKVSVDDAIKRGQLVVNLPVTIIIIGLMAAGAYLVVATTMPLLGIGIFASSFVLGWLYWSFAITKWKQWAYTNVDDIIALKKAAVDAYLIWPDDNVFNKTEIKTPNEAVAEQQILQKKNALYVPTKSPVFSNWKIYVVILAVLLMSGILRGLFH